MKWFREAFGLDLVDTAVHVVVTGLLLGFVDSQVTGRAQEAMMFLTAGASVVLFSIRRRLALRRAAADPQIGMTTGQMAAARIEELEARVAQLEATEVRLVEVEERLDFTERLLAQSTGERALTPGRPEGGARG